MTWEDLQENILATAHEQAVAITADFAARIAVEEKRIQQRASDIEETIMTSAQQEGTQEAQRLHQDHHLNAKAHVLEAKQAELNTTAQETVKAILAWDTATTRGFLEALVNSLPDKKGEIIPGSHHRKLLTTIIKGTAFSLSNDSVENDGGFIWRGTQAEVDATIRRLVATLFERHRTDIARRLLA